VLVAALGARGTLVIAGGISAAAGLAGLAVLRHRTFAANAPVESGAVSDIDILARNHVDLLPQGGLEKKLALGRPLRVKLGIDVTSPGPSTSGGRFAAADARLPGCRPLGVLIVGDYTTRIGDPSGRSAERRSSRTGDRREREDLPHLASRSSIRIEPEVRYNGEWLAKLDFADVVRLTRTMTVAQLTERETSQTGSGAAIPVSVSELLYPLMQAYDSVAIEPTSSSAAPTSSTTCSAGRTAWRRTGSSPRSC
jgi:tyrosyl-tRNA synthetase